jgi:RNA ligase (TIGR02306 family)
MAFFGVTKEKIGEVVNHPNADRLDIAKLEGMNFQFIVGRDQYKVGDDVVYFPIDSLIPPNVLARLGLVDRLAGKEKNRVKTVRLRGSISQGIVSDHDTLAGMSSIDKTDEQITNLLGVTKYEPPVVPTTSGNLVKLPMGLSAYDIEGADRYTEAAELLMDQKVAISEKVEGMNFSAGYCAQTGKTFVNQRNYSIEEIEGKEHMFWRLVRESGLLDYIEKFALSNINIIIYGEFVGPGVQGNIYKLDKHRVYLFDVKINDNWQCPIGFTREVSKMAESAKVGTTLEIVPLLAIDVTLREWLDGKTIQEASDGRSMIHDTKREGIVIKPMLEQRNDELGGRLILKQRSPLYLANSKL